jgi:hypothetical protein
MRFNRDEVNLFPSMKTVQETLKLRTQCFDISPGGRHVRLNGFHCGTRVTKRCGRQFDSWLVSGDQKVVSFLDAALGQFKSDTGGSASHDGEGTAQKEPEAPFPGGNAGSFLMTV